MSETRNLDTASHELKTIYNAVRYGTASKIEKNITHPFNINDFDADDFNSTLAIAHIHDQIKNLEAFDFDYVYHTANKKILIKDVRHVKEEDLNPLHSQEAQIQALRYLRGMLLIYENDTTLTTENKQAFLHDIFAAYQHYQNMVTTLATQLLPNKPDEFIAKSSQFSYLLYDQFCKIQAQHFHLKDGTKQVTMAKDLGILLEEQTAVVTISTTPDDTKLTLEKSEAVKISSNYYESEFGQEENRTKWLPNAIRFAGFPRDAEKTWLENFFVNKLNDLKSYAVPAPPSARWLPLPANNQIVDNYEASLTPEGELTRGISSNFIRMGATTAYDIKDERITKELAKKQLKEMFDQHIQARVANFRQKYGILANEPFVFNFNYQSLLTPHHKEERLGHKDNNAKFVLAAKEAMEELALEYANNPKEPLNPIKNGVIIHFNQTNAPINNVAWWPSAINARNDHPTRFRKLEQTERFLDSIRGEEKIRFVENNPELKREIEMRKIAAQHLRALLENKSPYKKLSHYRRNIMLASLEFIMEGNQALTLAGCKSARDRTAIFAGAVKTMQENPRAMINWSELNKGIMRSLGQGHHFRSMKYHSGIAKVGAVHKDFINQFPTKIKDAISLLKPFTKRIEKLSNRKLKKIQRIQYQTQKASELLEKINTPKQNVEDIQKAVLNMTNYLSIRTRATAPNTVEFENQSKFIQKFILEFENINERILAIDIWIKVRNACEERGDLYAASSIDHALASAPIARLHNTREGSTKEAQIYLSSLKPASTPTPEALQTLLTQSKQNIGDLTLADIDVPALNDISVSELNSLSQRNEEIGEFIPTSLLTTELEAIELAERLGVKQRLFINLDLEKYAAKLEMLDPDLIKKINQAATHKLISDKDFKKLLTDAGIHLNSKEIASSNKNNKQIYYRQQILNPVLAEMIEDSGIKIKSTTSHLAGRWVPTSIQIDKINAMVLSAELRSVDEIRGLLKNIGFHATNTQIHKIQQENNRLHRELAARSITSKDQQIAWLQHQRSKSFYNNDIFSLLVKLKDAEAKRDKNEIFNFVEKLNALKEQPRIKNYLAARTDVSDLIREQLNSLFEKNLITLRALGDTEEVDEEELHIRPRATFEQDHISSQPPDLVEPNPEIESNPPVEPDPEVELNIEPPPAAPIGFLDREINITPPKVARENIRGLSAHKVVVTAANKKYALLNSFSEEEWNSELANALKAQKPGFADLQPVIKNGLKRYQIGLGEGNFGYVRLAVELDHQNNPIKENGKYRFVVVKKTRMKPLVYQQIVKALSSAGLTYPQIKMLLSSDTDANQLEQQVNATNLSPEYKKFIIDRITETNFALQIAIKENKFNKFVLQERPSLNDIYMPIEAAAKTTNKLGNDVVYHMVEFASFGDGDTLIKKIFKEPTLIDVSEKNRLFLHVGESLLNNMNQLHSKAICHRDIKPGNLLFYADGKMKMSDFGASFFGGQGVSNQSDLAFWAPELYVSENYDFSNYYLSSADTWAMGLSLLEFYYGPNVMSAYFDLRINPQNMDVTTRTSILATKLILIEDLIQQIPDQNPLKPIIAGLLDKDFNQRLTASEAVRALTHMKQTYPQKFASPDEIETIFTKLSEAAPRANLVQQPVEELQEPVEQSRAQPTIAEPQPEVQQTVSSRAVDRQAYNVLIPRVSQNGQGFFTRPKVNPENETAAPKNTPDPTKSK